MSSRRPARLVGQASLWVTSTNALLLSLPVVFYCAWVFFDGAYRALRNRTLDMMVLVAVAVGAGWLYSAGSLSLAVARSSMRPRPC